MALILPNTFILKQVLAKVTLFCLETIDTKDLSIFDHLFLYIAYADDTFFLENKESIEEIVKTFFSGLKLNISKCEICGLGPLKEVEMAV